MSLAYKYSKLLPISSVRLWVETVRKEEMFGNSIKAIIKTSPDQSKSFAAPMQNTSVFLPLNVPFFAELLLRRADPILYCSLEIKYQQTGLALSGIKILEKDRD